MTSKTRANFISGTVADNPLASGATTFSSTALASLPTVASPVVATIIFDPNGLAPEIAYITAHTLGQTTATITRGQEGTVAAQWAINTQWVHGPTATDFDFPSLSNLPWHDVRAETSFSYGSTDDTDAIRAALLSCSGTQWEAVVLPYIGRNWVVSKLATLKPKNYTMILGPGPLQLAPGSNPKGTSGADIFLISGGNSPLVHDVKFKQLVIDGNYDNMYTAYTGVGYITSGTRSLFLSGVDLTGAQVPGNLELAIAGAGYNTGWLYASVSTFVTSAAGSTLTLQADPSPSAHTNAFGVDVRIWWGNYNGIMIKGRRVRIEDCEIINCNGPAVGCSAINNRSWPTDITVIGGRLASSFHGFSGNQARDFKVLGVEITGNRSNGFDVNHASGGLIDDCVVCYNGSEPQESKGILVYESDNVIVGDGNLVYNNGLGLGGDVNASKGLIGEGIRVADVASTKSTFIVDSSVVAGRTFYTTSTASAYLFTVNGTTASTVDTDSTTSDSNDSPTNAPDLNRVVMLVGMGANGDNFLSRITRIVGDNANGKAILAEQPTGWTATTNAITGYIDVAAHVLVGGRSYDDSPERRFILESGMPITTTSDEDRTVYMRITGNKTNLWTVPSVGRYYLRIGSEVMGPVISGYDTGRLIVAARGTFDPATGNTTGTTVSTHAIGDEAQLVRFQAWGLGRWGTDGPDGDHVTPVDIRLGQLLTSGNRLGHIKNPELWRTQLNAARTRTVTTTSWVSNSYTVEDGVELVLCATGNTSRTVVMPSASSYRARKVTIRKVDAGTGSINCGTVDGATFFLAQQYDTFTFMSDGSGWFLV